MSLAESLANIAVGYGIAVVTQAVVFPLFGLHVSLAGDMAIGGVMTLVWIIRSYTPRRVFEAARM